MDAGYEVIRIDLQHGGDVRLLALRHRPASPEHFSRLTHEITHSTPIKPAS